MHQVRARFVRERSLILPAAALWAILASVIALFVGVRPTAPTCGRTIGGLLYDPHYWDAICASVLAEWEAGLTIADRLMQSPLVWVVLVVVGWLAIAALVIVGGLMGAGRSPGPGDPAATA